MSAATEAPLKDSPSTLQIIDPSDTQTSSSSSILSPLSSPQFLLDSNNNNNNNNNTSNENDENVLGFTQSLLDRIQKSRTLLDKYVKEQRDKADQVIKKQADVHEIEKEEINLKLEELKGIQRRRGLAVLDENCLDNDVSKGDEDVGLAQQQLTLEKKLDEITRELGNCSLEHQKVEKNVKVVKEIEEHEFAKSEEVRKKRERIESSKQVTVDDLTLAVLKYEMLGVKFVKGNDLRLRCDFTQIDPSDPDRVFCFDLNINEEEEYEVEDCDPFLNASIVLNLVQDLNETNSWSNFVVGMRDAFKASIENE